jgi:predicted nucleic acid-binding Zn ribbon protein
VAKRKALILRFAVPFAILMFGCASLALARAGGGEGFGGDFGGGGGGGGDGNGSGILWLIYMWIRFCAAEPAIGIPVTLLGLGFFVFLHFQTRNALQNRVIRSGGAIVNANLANKAATTLKGSDPNFDETLFYKRVGDAFMKLQAAWSAQDLGTVRPFIADGIHEQFSIEFAEQKALGYRDQMRDVVINEILLAEVSCDDVFEVAAVRISASAADSHVSLNDGHRMSGLGEQEGFSEFWSFLRRRGVKTDPNKPGLIEGHCPNCGAGLEMNQSAKCPQCGSLLRSGQFDWVLAQITQESQWRPNRRVPPVGSDQIRKVDPAFNRVDLEDSVAVMFWRKVMADRMGYVDPLRKVATNDFCQKYAQRLIPDPEGTRIFFADCAVGAVQALGVTRNDKTQEAVVQVWWEGAQCSCRHEEPMVVGQERAHGHHLFVLQRPAGTTSDPGNSVSSSHCPSCGAPITSDVSSKCEFCGTVLNDGRHGWVLTAIHTEASSEGAAILDSLRHRAQWTPGVAPTGLVGWAIKTALADGKLDLEEERTVMSLATKNCVPPESVRQMVAAAQMGHLNLPDPPDAPTAHRWLAAMADVAMADGSPQPQELTLMSSIAKKYGFSDGDVALLLRQSRTQRLNEIRAAYRAVAGKPNSNGGPFGQSN